MKAKALIVTLASNLSLVAGNITPGDYKKFDINFDLPDAERYEAVFQYFEPQLRDMENYWWNEFYSEDIRSWFENHIDDLKVAQPEAYAYNLALAEFLGLSVT